MGRLAVTVCIALFVSAIVFIATFTGKSDTSMFLLNDTQGVAPEPYLELSQSSNRAGDTSKGIAIEKEPAPAPRAAAREPIEEQLGLNASSTELPRHADRGSDHCNSALSERLINNWRNGERVVCEDTESGVRVREFVQHGFEYRPQLYVYENVDFESPVGGILSNGCPSSTYHTGEFHNEPQPWARDGAGRAEYLARPVKKVLDRVLIRIKRFDVFNPYEAFHGFINTYFLIRVLNLSQDEIQFAFTDEDCGDSPRNEMIWNSINRGKHPIIFTNNNGVHRQGMYDGIAYRFKMAIRASSTGTSILCSNQPPLASRGSDHHCKSAAFRDAMAWMRDNYGSTIQWSLKRPLPRHRVVFTSRKAYKRTDLGGGNNVVGVHHIPRMLVNEDVFVANLQAALSTAYEVVLVNFGELSPASSIENATNADILLGVHGAALMWSGFLPRHGGLVELFPFGLQHVNRHYHNVAALADLHYRELPMDINGWGPSDVARTAEAIKSIPLHQLDKEP